MFLSDMRQIFSKMGWANRITLMRVGAIIPILILVHNPNVYTCWIAMILFALAAISDFVDGYIARKEKQVTNFGKFLDPLADKLLTIAAMTMLCQWGMMPAWALMIVLTREFAVTGLRLVAVGKGKVIAAGWSGKIKTASTMIGLCALMALPTVPWLAMVVNGVIIVTTVYSGIEYFVQNWNCLWN